MDKFAEMFGRGAATGLAGTLAKFYKPTDLQHLKNLLKMTTREKFDEKAIYAIAKYHPDVAKLIIARAHAK